MSPTKQTEWPDTVADPVTAGVDPAMKAGIRDGVMDLDLVAWSHLAAAPPADPQEFDAWLRGHLSRLYDAVLTEPVPERLLRLLRQAAG